MASRAVVVSSLLLAACGGTTYYAGATQVTALPVPEAYDCVKTQFTALGYKTAVHDDDARRLVGQKRDTVTHIADIQLRKVFDELEVDAKATKEGSTALTVLAHSFEERSNAGGVRVDERKASSQVQTDAVALLKNCGGAVGATQTGRPIGADHPMVQGRPVGSPLPFSIPDWVGQHVQPGTGQPLFRPNNSVMVPSLPQSLHWRPQPGSHCCFGHTRFELTNHGSQTTGRWTVSVVGFQFFRTTRQPENPVQMLGHYYRLVQVH